ncbi:MAG: hypothetical protein NTY38_26845 [Acidobacteria bacterium]|nr:hypothetical protein [Acidobacteriota bacterium]
MAKLARHEGIDHRLQQALDLAVVKQALRDLWLRTDGYRVRRKEQQELTDLMLDAAAWFFVAPRSGAAFSFRQICSRSRIDPTKATVAIFAGLPDERRREIWRALRHYRARLLPLSWQACGAATVPAKHPKGRRYLVWPPPQDGGEGAASHSILGSFRAENSGALHDCTISLASGVNVGRHFGSSGRHQGIP